MNEKEAREFLDQIRQVATQAAQEVVSTCVKVVPGQVVSVSGQTAVVKLTTDPSKTFTVPITTSQTIAAGNYVNIAYWNNLSTAIILSK